MNQSGAYHPLPRPSELTEREKEDAMGGYLMMFASIAAGLPLPIVNLIAAIVYYYMNRRKSRFIHFHAMQSLLTQFPVSILNAIFVIFTIQLFIVQDLSDGPTAYYIYAAIIGGLNLIYFVFSIVAAIKARKGKMYYFVFFGKYCYRVVYGTNRTFIYENEPESDINVPPR